LSFEIQPVADIFPVFAHESDIAHVHSADIALVTSNTVVQGTVVTTHKLGNSAIVNQTAVWEGRTYTFNPETGALVVRARDDTRRNLPALTIVRIENGRVHFSYTDSRTTSPVLFDKPLKQRSTYGLSRK